MMRQARSPRYPLAAGNYPKNARQTVPVTGSIHPSRERRRGARSCGVETPLLHNRRVYASRNVDETAAFMAAKEFRLDLSPREAGDFDFIANVAYLPGSYLGYIQYGAAATIDVPDVRVRDDYWLHVPVRGCCDIQNSLGTVLCSPEQAVFSSPVGHRTVSEPGSARVTLSVSARNHARPVGKKCCWATHPADRSTSRR